MPLQTTELDLLLQGCLSRHPASQKELVRRFAGSLLAVARRYVHSHAAAEDVLQDAFVLVFKNIDRYDAEKGSLHTWMRRIVINTALAQHRRFRYSFEKAVENPPDSADPDPDVLSKLSFDELLRLVEALPGGAREVFNLAVFDEFSHEEIGEILGIPAGTSRSLLSRARKLLQQQIVKLHAHEVV